MLRAGQPLRFHLRSIGGPETSREESLREQRLLLQPQASHVSREGTRRHHQRVPPQSSQIPPTRFSPSRRMNHRRPRRQQEPLLTRRRHEPGPDRLTGDGRRSPTVPAPRTSGRRDSPPRVKPRSPRLPGRSAQDQTPLHTSGIQRRELALRQSNTVQGSLCRDGGPLSKELKGHGAAVRPGEETPIQWIPG